MRNHPIYFLVDGYKVGFTNGIADFTKYGVMIRVAPEDFTYDWALKMDAKLQMLNLKRAGI